MTSEQHHELAVVTKYIAELSNQRRTIHQMMEQWRVLKKLDKEQQRLFDKSKKDSEKCTTVLNKWQELEEKILKETFGEEYVFPRYE
jgi:hypothetical protein